MQQLILLTKRNIKMFFKDKVMFLEKRLYKIIAGELSTKKVVKKTVKKDK